MKLCLALFLVGTCVSVAVAQYDGPVPPRPVIPGAVPVGSPFDGSRPAVRRRPVARVADDSPQRRQGGRGTPRRLPPPLEQSLQARPVPSGRDYDDTPARRPSLRAGPRKFPFQEQQQPLQPRQLARPIYQESPIAVVRAPVLTQPQQVPPRPVVEDEEDDEEEEEELSPFGSPTPAPLSIPFSQPTNPPPPPQQPNLDDFPVPTRQQYRQPQTQQHIDEPPPQFVRQPRPQQINNRQQQTESVTRYTSGAELSRPKPYAQQQYNRQQQVARPAQKEVAHTKASEPSNNRQKKPTSQTLRKYREDHPDGSITWGYENDDGSFKEETIGVDCVTTGKYGYVDPDGVRREFTYSSGIPCDKAAQEDSETQASEGYIDYTNNKYVFPNGETIDLNNMVRNRARKPVYRN